MPDPQSPDEWMVLARRKEAVARAMVEDRKNCAEAFTAAGIAVEYALKALTPLIRRAKAGLVASVA